MSKTYTTFTFEVTHDDECDMWVGVCDALGIATEAPSYEALTARIWLIAPEMAQENGLSVAPDCLCLRFEHVELADQLAAA
jgi:hypothetical protein